MTVGDWSPPVDLPELADVTRRIYDMPTGSLSEARNRAMLAVMLDSGGRVSEVLQTKWNDWEPGRGLVLVTMKRRKSKPRRLTLLSAETDNMLTGYQQRLWSRYGEVEYIFPAIKSPADSPMSRQMAHKVVKKALGFHPHLLRHVRATALVRAGRIDVAQKILGHASLSSTGAYLHPDLNEMRDVFNRSNQQAPPPLEPPGVKER